MTVDWAALGAIAANQYGLIHNSQLRSIMTRDQRRRAVQSGRLFSLPGDVYALVGVPRTWRQRALAACLAYGQPVAVSGTAAARLWELEAVACRTIEVTVPTSRSGRVAGVSTRRRFLRPDECTDRYSIPVTTLPRTFVDLAGELPIGALARALDDALSRRLVAASAIDAYLQTPFLAKRGGVGGLRDLISERTGEPEGAQSVREQQVCRWVVDAGLPPPVRQHRVLIGGVPRFLDLAYPDLLIAIEFQGFRYHGLQRVRFDADQRRTTELELAGWLVILVTSASTREQVVDQVRRARALQRAR